MRRIIAGLILLFALSPGGERLPTAADAGPLQAASDRVEVFYRSLPAIDPAHRSATGVEGPLCSSLRGNAPWVERTLLGDLRDPGRSDWLKSKSLFGLQCLWAAGESRCLGSLAEELVALDGDPAGLSPELRIAVTGWLERITKGMNVPLVDAGRYHRRDYGRWWAEGGRWLIQGTCADARI